MGEKGIESLVDVIIIAIIGINRFIGNKRVSGNV